MVVPCELGFKIITEYKSLFDFLFLEFLFFFFVGWRFVSTFQRIPRLFSSLLSLRFFRMHLLRHSQPYTSKHTYLKKNKTKKITIQLRSSRLSRLEKFHSQQCYSYSGQATISSLACTKKKHKLGFLGNDPSTPDNNTFSNGYKYTLMYVEKFMHSLLIQLS